MKLSKKFLVFSYGFLLIKSITVFSASENRIVQKQNINILFEKSSIEFGVPVDLLKVIGYVESRWQMRDGKPSRDNSYGIMGLREEKLFTVAKLLNITVEKLKNDAEANIRGGALLLSKYGRENKTQNLNDWIEAVKEYAPSVEISDEYAKYVFGLLKSGVSDFLPSGEGIEIKKREIDMRSMGLLESEIMSDDYPPALWDPAHSNNFTVSDRPNSYPINFIIIHTTEGSYYGAISWFKNPNSKVSAHYVMRSSDGEITQMVRNKDVAWHAGNWNYNTWSLGIEHEGYVSQWGWYTDTLYSASAIMTRYMCNKYGIPKTRSRIIGHWEVPGASHTDPGPYWDWRYYVALVVGLGQPDTLIDEFNYGFKKGGPQQFWRFDSAGFGGHMFYTYSAVGEDTNFATWRPAIQRDGRYEIFVFVPSRSSNAKARYKIYHRDGVTTRVIDQAIYSDVWVSLGIYNFSSGNSGYVYLGDATGTQGQRIGFDAVKWRYILTGVEEESEELKVESEKLSFEIYPNPATSKANFRLQITDSRLKIPDYKSSNLSIFQSSVSIKIYDVQGRLVREIPLTSEILPPTFRRGQNDIRHIVWDLRDDSGKRVSAGVYFVRVEVQKGGRAEGKIQTRRVVVLR